jgi:zinc dependent phospholipase C
MGYYPFSSRFFSDLTHYVRSGDFVLELIRDSQDLNEYAFTLGALEHYSADTDGHRIATNRAVPILYPELRRKFGSDVTYWDNPVAHIRTEFGFDVVQVALGRYAPDRYRSFIGFQVSREVLERAFRDTYGIEMKDVFGNVTIALGSCRHTVSAIIPGMTGGPEPQEGSASERDSRHHAQEVSLTSPGRVMKSNAERSTQDPHTDSGSGEVIHGEP